MANLEEKLEDRIDQILDELETLDPAMEESEQAYKNFDILYKLKLKQDEINMGKSDNDLKLKLRLIEFGLSGVALLELLKLSKDGFRFEQDGIFGSKNFTETRSVIRNCLMKIIFK